MSEKTTRRTPTVERETVLVTTIGTSPSVLTSTIWALAHRERLLPHRIKILTTRLGRDKLVEQVFTPSPNFGGRTVWESLCEHLGAEGFDLTGRLRFAPSSADLRVFTASSPKDRMPHELDDITTQSENEQVADTMLETLRSVMADDVQIIASIAGGRKTVSALFYACVSLIGRSDDRIIHVVVSEPFDRPDLQPPFFYPTQSVLRLTGRNGRIVRAKDAKLNVIEVPFVPLRNLFPKEIGHTPGKFSSLVAKYRDAGSRQLSDGLQLNMDVRRNEVLVNDKKVALPVREQFVLLFLVKQTLYGAPAFTGVRKELEDTIEAYRHDLVATCPVHDPTDWRCKLNKKLDEQDIRRALSKLRKILQDEGPPASLLLNALPKRGRFGLQLAKKQIRLIE
jgi:CRISPR-associated protein (TIGR02584 family)